MKYFSFYLTLLSTRQNLFQFIGLHEWWQRNFHYNVPQQRIFYYPHFISKFPQSYPLLLLARYNLLLYIFPIPNQNITSLHIGLLHLIHNLMIDFLEFRLKYFVYLIQNLQPILQKVDLLEYDIYLYIIMYNQKN